MPEPILAHTRISGESEPARWLFVLHGIYGTGRNWGSLARRFVEARPEWGVELVDLRLHGGSKGFSPPHTVEACAHDVRRLEDELGHSPDAILGHSFGGKVALVRAGLEPGIPQIWVADSTLRTGEPSGSAWQVTEIVAELPDRFETRDKVVDAMVKEGYDRGMGQWLAMNLERDAAGFVWGLDWDGVKELLRDYFATEVWPTVENPPEGSEIHMIRATRSNSIDPESVQRISTASAETGRVFLHEVEAGHWLNVDNSDAVLALLTAHIA